MIPALSPTDINRRVSYAIGTETKSGTIAGFNESYVHVVVEDGHTLPMPWGILELEAIDAPEIQPDAHMLAAISRCVHVGAPYRVVDKSVLEIADKAEVNTPVGVWRLKGEAGWRPGGVGAALAALGYGQPKAILELAGPPAVLARPNCEFSHCPHPDLCREACASERRSERAGAP